MKDFNQMSKREKNDLYEKVGICRPSALWESRSFPFAWEYIDETTQKKLAPHVTNKTTRDAHE